MSTYNKELISSLKESAIVTGVTVGTFMALKYLFKVTPPTAKLDPADIFKLGGGIAAGVFVKDYAVDQKWINPI